MHGPLRVYAYKLSNSPQNSCISCRNWTIQATGERQCPQFPVMSRESALTRSHRHRNSCPRRPTKIHRYLCHSMSPWAGFILTIPISSFLASHPEGRSIAGLREKGVDIREPAIPLGISTRPIYSERNRNPAEHAASFYINLCHVESYPLLGCSYATFVGGIIEIVRGSVNSSGH